jgi:hypothetical protein
VVRYRFGNFVVSPRRRLLVRDGRELPLIPRYFDLLVLLIERRHEAVHRRDIFERVWTDVIVSDSALSQAGRSATTRASPGSSAPSPATDTGSSIPTSSKKRTTRRGALRTGARPRRRQSLERLVIPMNRSWSA